MLSQINCNNAALNSRGTGVAWKAVKNLRDGLEKTVPANVKPMKKADGSLCKTPEENAEVFRVHFEKLFSKTPSYDPTVLEDLPQKPVVEDCDAPPTDEEIAKAVKQLKNSGPGESGVNAKVWKCLLKSPETYALIKKFVMYCLKHSTFLFRQSIVMPTKFRPFIF